MRTRLRVDRNQQRLLDFDHIRCEWHRERDVQYSVAPYTGRPSNRNGTMTIAGQTFSIKQSRWLG
jgi:hypothetical protein